MRPDATILFFWMLSFKPTFSLSSFTFKMLFSSSLSVIRVVSSAYLMLLIFLLATLIQFVLHSVQHFSRCTVHMLNMQSDNIRPLPIWNQSVVRCPVLTCFLTCIQISQKAEQTVWYSHLLNTFPQFVVIHTVKCFGIVNKAEIDVFLELSCFLYDRKDIGNLISGSSAFLKSSLNIWKFIFHVLLKPCLENIEHYFASV